MLLIIVRVMYAFVCAGAIAALQQPKQNLPPLLDEHPIFTFTGLMLLSQSVTLLDVLFPRKRLDLISAIYFGLLIGTLLSYLLAIALQPVLPPQIRTIVVSLTVIILPYLCISMILQTKDDFRFVIP